MNDFNVVFKGGNFSDSGSALKLVDSISGEEFDISHNFSEFSRLKRSFSPIALDLVYLALSAYACDRAVSRDEADDRWTRDIALTLPVQDLDVWKPIEDKVSHLLSFLTGDRWTITFNQRSVKIFGNEFLKEKNKWRKKTKVTGNVACLFSGGLDSYIGAINWLENNPANTITLSGAYDPDAEGARADQKRLLNQLQARYPGRMRLFTSRMGISGKGKESTYRSRSFCFISFGVLASTFQSNGTTVLIPENGTIALNYPLSPARYGSSSTRTVHPFFIQRLQDIIYAIGLSCELKNPYQLSTKGEMVADCLALDFLKNTYHLTVSCGNRKRFKIQVPPSDANQCGFCVPCLFRRASLFKLGLNGDKYGAYIEDQATWGRSKLDQPNTHFSDIREFVRANESDAIIRRRILANGSLGESNIHDYVSLVKRQREELRTWLKSLGSL